MGAVGCPRPPVHLLRLAAWLAHLVAINTSAFSVFLSCIEAGHGAFLAESAYLCLFAWVTIFAAIIFFRRESQVRVHANHSVYDEAAMVRRSRKRASVEEATNERVHAFQAAVGKLTGVFDEVGNSATAHGQRMKNEVSKLFSTNGLRQPLLPRAHEPPRDEQVPNPLGPRACLMERVACPPGARPRGQRHAEPDTEATAVQPFTTTLTALNLFNCGRSLTDGCIPLFAQEAQTPSVASNAEQPHRRSAFEEAIMHREVSQDPLLATERHPVHSAHMGNGTRRLGSTTNTIPLNMSRSEGVGVWR